MHKLNNAFQVRCARSSHTCARDKKPPKLRPHTGQELHSAADRHHPDHVQRRSRAWTGRAPSSTSTISSSSRLPVARSAGGPASGYLQKYSTQIHSFRQAPSASPGPVPPRGLGPDAEHPRTRASAPLRTRLVNRGLVQAATLDITRPSSSRSQDLLFHRAGRAAGLGH